MTTPVLDPRRDAEVRRLRHQRSRDAFVRWSVVLLLALVAHGWLSGEFGLADFVSDRRLANLRRFLGELVPYPLQGRPWDFAVAGAWADALMTEKGWLAVATTLSVSVAAIGLAGLGGVLLSLPAARSLAAPEPYLPHAAAPARFARAGWGLLVAATRTGLMFLRAIPEYVWAFLLIATLGPVPWAAVLALAVHNTGILGKLNAEVIENLEPAPMAGLRALGAGRAQIAIAGVLPAIVPRFLLFFFYRWETCVREATVLGMLGIVSLGYFVQDARARQQYDVMFALILLGSAVVLLGDLVSVVARATVRRSD
jgi:phosphonate transport system permease protein